MTRAANNQMQRTVRDKVPKVKRGRPAADLERYTLRLGALSWPRYTTLLDGEAATCP